MAKMTYGFPTNTNKDEATQQAVEKALADELMSAGQTYSVEFLETDDHVANNEFVVILRTEEE